MMVLVCCKNAAEVHPAWTYDTVMYEVNVRQYSPEGTFAGVEAQLPRLKELGVDIIEEKLGKETLPMDTVRLCNGLFSVGRNLRIEYKNGGPEGYKFYNFIKDPEDGNKNINYHRE